MGTLKKARAQAINQTETWALLSLYERNKQFLLSSKSGKLDTRQEAIEYIAEQMSAKFKRTITGQETSKRIKAVLRNGHNFGTPIPVEFIDLLSYKQGYLFYV